MFEVFELSYWKNIFVLNIYIRALASAPQTRNGNLAFKNSDILINNIVHTGPY